MRGVYYCFFVLVAASQPLRADNKSQDALLAQFNKTAALDAGMYDATLQRLQAAYSGLASSFTNKQADWKKKLGDAPTAQSVTQTLLAKINEGNVCVAALKGLAQEKAVADYNAAVQSLTTAMAALTFNAPLPAITQAVAAVKSAVAISPLAQLNAFLSGKTGVDPKIDALLSVLSDKTGQPDTAKPPVDTAKAYDYLVKKYQGITSAINADVAFWTSVFGALTEAERDLGSTAGQKRWKKAPLYLFVSNENMMTTSGSYGAPAPETATSYTTAAKAFNTCFAQFSMLKNFVCVYETPEFFALPAFAIIQMNAKLASLRKLNDFYAQVIKTYTALSDYLTANVTALNDLIGKATTVDAASPLARLQSFDLVCARNIDKALWALFASLNKKLNAFRGGKAADTGDSATSDYQVATNALIANLAKLTHTTLASDQHKIPVL